MELQRDYRECGLLVTGILECLPLSVCPARHTFSLALTCLPSNVAVQKLIVFFSYMIDAEGEVQRLVCSKCRSMCGQALVSSAGFGSMAFKWVQNDVLFLPNSVRLSEKFNVIILIEHVNVQVEKRVPRFDCRHVASASAVRESHDRNLMLVRARCNRNLLTLKHELRRLCFMLAAPSQQLAMILLIPGSYGPTIRAIFAIPIHRLVVLTGSVALLKLYMSKCTARCNARLDLSSSLGPLLA
jgi:hypothetical protein